MEQGVSGMRTLYRAILDDTKEEAERIVAQAQQAAATTRQQAEAKAASVRREILDRARNEITHLRQQAMATARLEAQRVLLSRREELIDAVFAQATQQLERIQQRDSYDTILQGLITDAVEQLGEPAEGVVRATEKDQSRLGEAGLAQIASRWAGRVRLRLGEPIHSAGGVVLETPDGRQRYDNTFEARLTRERSRLRATVYQLLQGET